MYMFEAHASETSWIHEDFNVSFEDEIVIMDWGNDKIMRLSPRISDDGELSLKYQEPSTEDPFVTDMILSMLKGAVDDPSDTEAMELFFVRSWFRSELGKDYLLLYFDLVQ